ncbi:unnamed protein product, partial [Brassica oleracea]
FLSPIQVDIIDSQHRLFNLSDFRIVHLFPIAFSCFRSELIIHLLSISVDRVSTGGVRCRVDCAAEFVCVGVLRLCSACFRLCAIPIRVDRVFDELS